jgi:Methyltransferase FkbM domain
MALDFRHHLKAYLGIYEYELLSHFKRMVTRGTNCFDIGGRDGYDALMMANLSRGRVASFECDHVAAEEMRQTFAQNPKLSLQVVESFVGTEGALGQTSIDRASRELFVPSFIKLDIEGAEDMALDGAEETLEKHRPNLIIEVHGADKEEKCISTLRRFGYSITIVNQGKLLQDPARLGYNRWIAAYH